TSPAAESPIGSSKDRGEDRSDESTTVDQGALRALQDRQASRRDADHLQEPAAQGATGLSGRRGLWHEWREGVCPGRSGTKVAGRIFTVSAGPRGGASCSGPTSTPASG